MRRLLVAVPVAAVVVGLASAVVAPAPSSYAAAALVVTPGNGVFGLVDVGQTKDITFTVDGADPAATVPGPSTLSGSNADQFLIASDGCDGQTLGLGDSCAVTVTFRPTYQGDLSAALTVPSSAPNGQSYVGLGGQSLWPAAGQYFQLSTTTRLLDTRRGLGANGPVAAGRTVHLPVAGKAGIPATGASAVVLNLTVTGPTSGGYVTAFPSGQQRPTASSINFPRGWTGANLVTVPIGANGAVDLYNCCGSVSLIADMIGWYAKDNSVLAAHGSGLTYHLALPERLLDTRTWGYGKLPSHYRIDLPTSYGSAFNDRMVAVAVNVTALGATGSGYVTAFQYGHNPTRNSTLNVRPGVVTSNLAIVHTVLFGSAPGVTPKISIYNGTSRPLHILVDAVGFYTVDYAVPDGLRYHPVSPTRIVDTRKALGTTTFGPASTHSVTVPGSLAGADTQAVVGNLTVVKPTTHTFMTLWADYPGFGRPPVSTLNPSPGSTVAVATMTELGTTKAFNLYNAAGRTDVAYDVAGTFETFPPTDLPALRGVSVPSQRRPAVAHPSVPVSARPTPIAPATH